MTFRINIECETAAEAIAELIHAASFYQKNPAIAAAPEVVVAKPRAKKEPAPAVDPTPAASPAVTPSPTKESTASTATAAGAVSPSDDGNPFEAEPVSVVTIDTVRAFLTPYLSDPDQAPRVTALIAEVGGAQRLSQVSIPNLAKLLAAAKVAFA